MPNPQISNEALKETAEFVQQALQAGFKIGSLPSAISEAHRLYLAAGGSGEPSKTYRRWRQYVARFGQPPMPEPAAPRRNETTPEPSVEDIGATLRGMLKTPKSLAELSAKTRAPLGDVLDALDELKSSGVNITRQGDLFSIPPLQAQAYIAGPEFELVSRPDNTFCFGAFGDLHAGSKYTRWDVREDLIRRSEKAGAQAIFDTGNWIDGASRFNTHDLVAHGLEEQCKLLAELHPKTTLPIYAVAGDDHEGWIASREGVNVGRYCEGIMRAAGHDWTDLGYMEAHVRLVNANTGKVASLAVVHPGGGSAYALSYSIQKIVESYEGGEKPNVALYGHYHKLWAGIIRNVWVAQTGCQQDQTPFMRKKRLEAHVGGTIITLEQDPESGAILAMTPQILRYFNVDWYAEKRWSHHGPVGQPRRTIGAVAA